MPLTKPLHSASEEEWEAYFAKKGASKKKREAAMAKPPEKERGRGIYERTKRHRRLQRDIQNNLPRPPKQRKKRPKDRRKNARWVLDAETLRALCEDATGISIILTIHITPGEPNVVRDARRLEWYMLREYARMNFTDIAEYYGLKWWDVSKHIKKYESIASARKVNWRYFRIKEHIDAASQTPKTLRLLTFQQKVR